VSTPGSKSHFRVTAHSHLGLLVALCAAGFALLSPLTGTARASATQRAATTLSTGSRLCAAKLNIAAAPTSGSGLRLRASTATKGCIELYVDGASTAPVEFSEVEGEHEHKLGATQPREGVGISTAFIAWRCATRRRVFRAREANSEGGTEASEVVVSTPSCANRVSMRLVPPPRLHFGMSLKLELHDSWNLGGIRVRACSPGRARWRCTRELIAPGSSRSYVKVRLASTGHVPISLESPAQRLVLHVHVLRTRPVILATGDSEMELLDNFIGERLGGPYGARVVGDAKHSTALTSPFYLNWFTHAAAQVRHLHPDIVAMFLGGNEGFSIGSAECCGAAWTRGYAKLVERMIRTYIQNGAASVYWFLVPMPGREPFIKVINGVDAAVIEAVHQFPERAHVFDLRPRFSPHGRYLPSVHQPDGFHLNTAADRVVAGMFVAQLRRDGLIAP